jgi:hypothetical protein
MRLPTKFTARDDFFLRGNCQAYFLDMLTAFRNRLSGCFQLIHRLYSPSKILSAATPRHSISAILAGSVTIAPAGHS